MQSQHVYGIIYLKLVLHLRREKKKITVDKKVQVLHEFNLEGEYYINIG